MKGLSQALLFFLVSCGTAYSRQNILLEDMRSAWLVYEAGEYFPFAERPISQISMVYLLIEPANYSGAALYITNDQPVSLFVNRTLLGEKNQSWFLTMDTLIAIGGGGKVLLSINASNRLHPERLKTEIISVLPYPVAEVQGPEVRQEDPIKPFVVVVLFSLSVFFVLLVRLNTKQVSHFLSLRGVFSNRDTDESQAIFRFTGSGNFLFYVFASLLTAFVLVLCLHDLTDEYRLAYWVNTDSWPLVMLSWFKVSVMLLLVLFVKAMVTYLAALLFGMTDQARAQFNDFIRIIILSMLLLGVAESVVFLTAGATFSLNGYAVIGWVLALWIVVLFVKQAGRRQVSVFHLFSYICVTEIIPFLFIVKILYE